MICDLIFTMCEFQKSKHKFLANFSSLNVNNILLTVEERKDTNDKLARRTLAQKTKEVWDACIMNQTVKLVDSIETHTRPNPKPVPARVSDATR